jgi:hypothetical protein
MTDEHDPYTLNYRAKPGDRTVPAITVAQLARLKGWTTKYAGTVVARLKPAVEPFPEPVDGRTPAYPRAKLLRAIDGRPGKGANLRGHR